ncbi:hypothetical protein D3C72_1434600 [compost metagenome]
MVAFIPLSLQVLPMEIIAIPFSLAEAVLSHLRPVAALSKFNPTRLAISKAAPTSEPMEVKMVQVAPFSLSAMASPETLVLARSRPTEELRPQALSTAAEAADESRFIMQLKKRASPELSDTQRRGLK